jgi:localization factor PodJL
VTAPVLGDPPPATSATEPALPASPARPEGRQSTVLPAGADTPNAAPSVAAPQNSDLAVDREPTGSVRVPAAQDASFAAPAAPLPPPSPRRSSGADKLPPGIGSGGLRAAAVKGDPAAEYEIALRYAEGRGVPRNLSEAAVWFERAAKQHLIPALFRLGGLYEKGLGVTKSLQTARRLYSMAAEAGNAKAMHNLAVLYAEGVGGKPDYQTAARWFRKAADHGVNDSQYNLGILYARGIGVETNMAEAYKWFALASRNGDREATKKRDDVASRLDRQSLAAAIQAAQNWKALPQPEAAVHVRAPAGGWDGAPEPAAAQRRVGPKG